MGKTNYKRQENELVKEVGRRKEMEEWVDKECKGHKEKLKVERC